MTTLKLAAAAILVVFAGVMWFAFIRKVPEQTGTGTIAGRYFKPEGTYSLQQTGADRGFRMPTRIPVAAAYIFDVVLDGSGEHASIALNVQAAEDFADGQAVRVRYVRRGLPPYWQRLMIRSMESR